MGRQKRKGKARKSRRGMLGSFKYPSRHAQTKKPSMLRRVLGWAGGALLLAALGFVLVLLVWRMFSPDYGVEQREATFVPAEIEVYDEPIEVADADEPIRVASARVEIEGYGFSFQLTAAQLEGVQAGAGIRAVYTYAPVRRGSPITIDADGWYVEGVDDPPTEPADPDRLPD